jgi:tRNA threonylcarbamoyl adenosine modification protein (Sua5/YciO/YrdC/YwlC family)
MERLTITEKDRPNQKLIKKVADVIRSGGVIVYPTDTVYGFGVDSGDADALERLEILKKREKKGPPLIMVADVSMAREYATFTPEAKRLADTFLPGPLALILSRNPDAPENVLPGTSSIGIRIPNNAFCLMLARALSTPITSTSVNISGEPPLTDPDDIETLFGDSIDLLIEEGPLNNPSSTIVDFSGDVPKVIREGAISVIALNL